MGGGVGELFGSPETEKTLAFHFKTREVPKWGKSEKFQKLSLKSERRFRMEERATLMFLQIYFISFRCFENQNWRFSFGQNLFPISSQVHILPAPIAHLDERCPSPSQFLFPALFRSVVDWNYGG